MPTVASTGPDGRSHLVPLWFVVEDGELPAWTYRSSRKVANPRRRPEATVQPEAGEGCDELRGVTMECDVRPVEEQAEVAGIGAAVAARYSGHSGPEVDALVAAQAAKRVGCGSRRPQWCRGTTASWAARTDTGPAACGRRSVRCS